MWLKLDGKSKRSLSLLFSKAFAVLRARGNSEWGRAERTNTRPIRQNQDSLRPLEPDYIGRGADISSRQGAGLSACLGNGLPATGVFFYLAVLNSWRTAAKAVFCQLLPAMPGHSIPGNLPD